LKVSAQPYLIKTNDIAVRSLTTSENNLNDLAKITLIFRNYQHKDDVLNWCKSQDQNLFLKANDASGREIFRFNSNSKSWKESFDQTICKNCKKIFGINLCDTLFSCRCGGDYEHFRQKTNEEISYKMPDIYEKNKIFPNDVIYLTKTGEIKVELIEAFSEFIKTLNENENENLFHEKFSNVISIIKSLKFEIFYEKFGVIFIDAPSRILSFIPVAYWLTYKSIFKAELSYNLEQFIPRVTSIL